MTIISYLSIYKLEESCAYFLAVTYISVLIDIVRVFVRYRLKWNHLSFCQCTNEFNVAGGCQGGGRL